MRILVIIQRSNGDVFFANTVIKYLFNNYSNASIDILVNDDTFQVAKLIPNINQTIIFSYKEKSANRWTQERRIFEKIYRKYDLSINLTASDRSVIYALLSSKNSISAVEKNSSKSWWKKILLKNYYFFNPSKHIIENNLQALDILGFEYKKEVETLPFSKKVEKAISKKLKNLNINKFLIFHPSAQYNYKIYPQDSRNKLLEFLDRLNIPIVITGGRSEIDLSIKDSIPKGTNFINLIGETSIEEYVVLSHLSLGYLGMDTLNMHIAASQNKRVFAIFGPTILRMWSPWSNTTNSCASVNQYINKYGNITIFQADLSCVACGNMGCNNEYDESECLNYIDPKFIYEEIKNFINNKKIQRDFRSTI